MTTGAIIAIVVAAVLIIAVVAFLLPRMRRKAEIQQRERELQHRRDRVADEHRSEAERAEERARSAQREAEAARAEAQRHEERAGLHERGEADDELIDDHERDRFAGTSATRDGVLDDDRPEHERPARFNRENAPAGERSEPRY